MAIAEKAIVLKEVLTIDGGENYLTMYVTVDQDTEDFMYFDCLGNDKIQMNFSRRIINELLALLNTLPVED